MKWILAVVLLVSACVDGEVSVQDPDADVVVAADASTSDLHPIDGTLPCGALGDSCCNFVEHFWCETDLACRVVTRQGSPAGTRCESP